MTSMPRLARAVAANSTRAANPARILGSIIGSPSRLQGLRKEVSPTFHDSGDVNIPRAPSTSASASASAPVNRKPPFYTRPPAQKHFPPFTVADLHESLRAELLSRIPSLNSIAQHYLQGGGKAIRPTLLLHLGRALHRHQPNGKQVRDEQGLLPKQRRLTEIIELIHTASLLHDDVIDRAVSRRGVPSAPSQYGSKSTILAGDYMLAQASLALAEIGCLPVVRMMAASLKELVEGEMLQAGASLVEQLSHEHYIRRCYLKTASLLARGCEAMACLGGHPGQMQQSALLFGHHLGVAFQIIDDRLDWVGQEEELGKPVASDLRNGIITAPVLFAAQEKELVKDLLAQGLPRGEEDVERIIGVVQSSSALQKTQELAEQHLRKALEALSFMPSTLINESFAELIASVTSRTK